MSKKVLFIVGSLREGSFNHQMALEPKKLLQVRLRLATLTTQLFLSLAKILKFLHFQLLQRLAKLF